MSEYNATVTWKRNGEKFTDQKYPRSHTWEFDGGLKVSASSSPQVVPLPYSDPEAVDPEEAFLASLSSCHMLWFLSIAAKNGYIVDEYKDNASAVMEKNAEGRLAITRVILHPEVTYSGKPSPGKEENEQMHHEAHEKCFIANSVRSEIEIKTTISNSDPQSL